MKQDDRKLNIIDENENIIGIETRYNIHTKGLLHRETHIWFYTSNSEVILQHRAKDKDTYPDLLDITVGGHVEIGSNFEETAIKEAFEETGVVINPKDLYLVKKINGTMPDNVVGAINHRISNIYAFLYDDDIKNLKIEEGKIIGFEKWKIDDLFNISEEDKKRFILHTFEDESIEILKTIKNNLISKSDRQLI